MGVGTADEMGVAHAYQLDVVDIAPFAGDETFVFLAHDARANALNTHVPVLPVGVHFPPFPSKLAVLISSGP